MNQTKAIGPLKGIWILITLVSISCQHDRLRLQFDPGSESPQVNHGFEALWQLESGGVIDMVDKRADMVLSTAIDTVQFDSESYGIRVDGDRVWITSGGQTGLMYGLLDIRDQIGGGMKQISPREEHAALPFRALKFNLPWDSYRTGEALDLHMETCRDTVFWKAFLDMMAENRFNALTLWNLHPFNYLVRTEKYPEACGFSDEEMEEWTKFWHTLFRMARDRGIETYLVNWNIFVSPEFAKAHGVATYSIEKGVYFENGDTSELVRDYMRECVRTVIDTYPDLTGLGVTLGEGMGGMSPEEREQWILDTFVEGARMASRKIKFIHRVPLSAGLGSGGSTSGAVEVMTRRTLDTLSCFDGPMTIELKFNWSHAHSSTSLAKVHGGKLTDAYWNPMPENYRLAWMMRNEDFFMLRWGQPDFIREHISKNVHPFVRGYFVGSECYIPARDYFSSLGGTGWSYAFERQWMFYACWGRLLYNPETPDSYFEQAFKRRFPGHGSTLFEAQRKVSRVPLIIASYWDASWDFTLYSEGMSGFNDAASVKLLSLEEMSRRIPMDPHYMGIGEYLGIDPAEPARGIDRQGPENMIDPAGPARVITPLLLADSLESFCSRALEDVMGIDPAGQPDLLYEVTDIKAWACLGLYFSDKLRAAMAYREYRETSNPESHRQAVEWLEKATGWWRELVEVTESVYEPVPLMHYTHDRESDLFHWSIVEKEVADELEWLRSL